MQDQLASPPEDALPLREALRQFVADDLWRAYEAAMAERRKLPRRPSYFSTSVREWEAERANRTANQARPAQADMHRAWAAIKRSLIDQLIAGDLNAFAQSDPPFGPWRAIPAAAWRSLHIKHVRHGHVMGPNVDLKGLHILNTPDDGASMMKTGYSGRPPLSRDVIEAEFARRIEAGEIEPSMVRQSLVLLDWFKINHPGKPAPKAKSIENNLRKAYREAASRIEQTSPK